jgi:two-component system, NarL family, nitrate/nitrite response regulator NarL
MKSLKLYIVDDNDQFRDGLRFYLEIILGHKVIGESANGPEFLKSTITEEADIVLLDISMPIMNGIEVARTFLKDHNQRFIAITNLEDQKYMSEMEEIGIKGYVLKKDIHSQLRKAMDIVMNDGSYFPDLIIH